MHPLSIWFKAAAVIPAWVREKEAKGQLEITERVVFYEEVTYHFQLQGVENQWFDQEGYLWIKWPGYIATIVCLPGDALAYEVFSPGLVLNPCFRRPRANHNGGGNHASGRKR